MSLLQLIRFEVYLNSEKSNLLRKIHGLGVSIWGSLANEENKIVFLKQNPRWRTSRYCSEVGQMGHSKWKILPYAYYAVHSLRAPRRDSSHW